MTIAEAIANVLLTVQAVRLSTNPPFTWTSGIKAPIYCDNRLLISYPKERQQIIEGFKQLIAENNLTFDVIGGTATAAIPWAAFLAHELNLPMVYIRPEPKKHGAGKQVEGTMKPGARVLIVEDLISTGGSSIRSADACVREYNASIVGIMAIFTYEMRQAKNASQERSIPFFTLSDFSTLVDVATEKNFLAPADKTAVLTWSEQPETWGIQASSL